MENNRDTLWVDYVRVAASFLVILVHTCSSTVTQYTSLPIIDWQVGNVYASLARVAVPLFFMLSGYLLLEKKESLQDVFFKRIKKILIPLIAWSIFYIFWGIRNVGFEQLALNDFSEIFLLQSIFIYGFYMHFLGYIYVCRY